MKSQIQLPIDRWICASWNEYEQAIAILEEALRRSREINQSEVGAWLLSQFQ